MSKPARIVLHLVAAAAVIIAATQLPSPLHVPAAIAVLYTWAVLWRRFAARRPPDLPLREVGRQLEKTTALAAWLRSELATTRMQYDRMVLSIAAANGGDPGRGPVAELRRTFMAACDEVEEWIGEADLMAHEIRRHIVRYPRELDHETPPRLAMVWRNAFTLYKRALIEVEGLRGYLT